MTKLRSQRRIVAWLRNDLRLEDNAIFRDVDAEIDEVLVVYCLDPRYYAPSQWPPSPASGPEHRSKYSRTGTHRELFILESLVDLDESLRNRYGNRLLVFEAMPENVIPVVCSAARSVNNTACAHDPDHDQFDSMTKSVVRFQAEDTSDEQAIELAVIEGLERKCDGTTVETHFSHTLLDRRDLAWDPVKFLPMPFGKFFHETAKVASIREPFSAPRELPFPAQLDIDAVFGLGNPSAPNILARVDLEKRISDLKKHQQHASIPDEHEAFPGGERAGQARLSEYHRSRLGSYHRTRNQLYNAGSGLSPYLAHGCLSPRTVYSSTKRAEAEGYAPSEATFKLFFELCWRDYFRFYCAQNGCRVFFKHGPAQISSSVAKTWKRDADLEQRWRDGCTGEPLIDAIMTELKHTGFCTNRARYIVAWYLVHRLSLDWRVGADWFEHILVDHDVCSNYGEWGSMANVTTDKFPLGLKGHGPKTNTRAGAPWAVPPPKYARQSGSTNGSRPAGPDFDPVEQAAQYDRKGEYQRRWLAVKDASDAETLSGVNPVITNKLSMQWPAVTSTAATGPSGLGSRSRGSKGGKGGKGGKGWRGSSHPSAEQQESKARGSQETKSGGYAPRRWGSRGVGPHEGG